MISALGGIVTSQATFAVNFPRYSSDNGAQVQANTRLRTLAIEALGKVGRIVLPTMLVASKDRDASVRAGAVQILGVLGPIAREVVPALVRGLGDRDAWVRLRSVESLAKAGMSSPSAMAALVDGLGHKDTMVRRAVVQALAPANSPRPTAPAAEAHAPTTIALRPAALGSAASRQPSDCRSAYP